MCTNSIKINPKEFTTVLQNPGTPLDKLITLKCSPAGSRVWVVGRWSVFMARSTCSGEDHSSSKWALGGVSREACERLCGALWVFFLQLLKSSVKHHETQELILENRERARLYVQLYVQIWLKVAHWRIYGLRNRTQGKQKEGINVVGKTLNCFIS